ncbi:MAG: hypothetical protein WCW52_09045 [Elusimicrobiales bacterium]|jgi:hypothetical protein
MEMIMDRFLNKYKFRIETKKDWNKLATSSFPEDVALEIKETLSVKERRTDKFTVEKCNEIIAPYRPEEALERLILQANRECSNQHNLKQAKKENIDLVHKHGNKIELIELKPWECCNSPLYGLIEIVKNEFFYKHPGKEISLTFLAPKAYYINFSKKKEVLTSFLRIAKVSNVKIACIDLSQDAFLEKVSDVAKKDEGQWVPKNGNRLQKKISFKILDEDDGILNPLRHDNWKVITQAAEWPTT